MGDEKDYFDKVFGLVDKFITNHESLKERVQKLETRFSVATVIVAAITLILGSSNPLIRQILALLK